MVIDSRLIQGKRVVLRPYEAGFTEAELRRMYEWSRDETLLRWSGGSPLVMSLKDFKEALRHELRQHDRHSRSFSLLTNTGEFIGRLGYYNIDYRRREAELGIAIGERKYWGHGYGTDAVKALLAHIFQETNLERVYLYAYADNGRAQRAFEKCGFRTVDQSRKFSLEHGSYEEIKMEIYRDDWVNQHAFEKSID